MKTFFSAGKLGDLIYSLPCIKALGGGILYIPDNTHECRGLYSNIKTLLLQQPYIKEVRQAPDVAEYHQCPVQVDYDLDEARLQPMLGKIHIVRRYLDAFGVELHDWKTPWLHVSKWLHGSYTVVNYTGRHLKEQRFDWRSVNEGIAGVKYFVGTKEEHQLFERMAGKITYLYTPDVLALAQIVAGASAVYCNQSLVTALAQGCGVPLFLQVKKHKTNCILGNEIVLK